MGFASSGLAAVLAILAGEVDVEDDLRVSRVRFRVPDSISISRICSSSSARSKSAWVRQALQAQGWKDEIILRFEQGEGKAVSKNIFNFKDYLIDL